MIHGKLMQRQLAPAAPQIDSRPIQLQLNSTTPDSVNANEYAYANDNPLTGMDPSGHDCDEDPESCVDEGGGPGSGGGTMVDIGDEPIGLGTEYEATELSAQDVEFNNMTAGQLDKPLTGNEHSKFNDLYGQIMAEGQTVFREGQTEELHGGLKAFTMADIDQLVNFQEEMSEARNNEDAQGDFQALLTLFMLYRGYIAYLDGPTAERFCETSEAFRVRLCYAV